MPLLENVIIPAFWRSVKKQDEKRLAKQQTPSDLTQINNIPYADKYHKLNLLDVYYPMGTKSTDKLPIVIDVHGGGWYYGDKELNKNYCLAIAQRGYCVFNMSYRLCPEVTMAQQLQDVMKALRWIKKHTDEFPCDENKILLTGDSAGGQLAFFAGCLCKSEKLRDIFDTVNPEFVPDCLGLTSPVAYLNPGKNIMGLNALTVVGRDYKSKKYAEYLTATKIIEETPEIPPAFVVTSSGDGIGKGPSIDLFNEIKSSENHAQLMNWTPYRGKDLPHVFSVGYPQEEPGIETINTMLDYFLKQCGE